MPPPPTFEARLVRARPVTGHVRELTFERVDGQPMAFDAGQWVNAVLPVAIGATEDITRSYSIASPPDGTARFEIAFTRVKDGPGSTWLYTLEPGVGLPLIEPQGLFTRPASKGHPSLIVATGKGVTPSPLWLVLGARREQELVYRDELEALAKANDFVRFVPTLSRPDAPWDGRRGYVQAHVRELWDELASLGAAPHAYVCGLERMVSSVRELLRKDMAVARQQVHSERYD